MNNDNSTESNLITNVDKKKQAVRPESRHERLQLILRIFLVVAIALILLTASGLANISNNWHKMVEIPLEYAVSSTTMDGLQEYLATVENNLQLLGFFNNVYSKETSDPIIVDAKKWHEKLVKVNELAWAPLKLNDPSVRYSKKEEAVILAYARSTILKPASENDFPEVNFPNGIPFTGCQSYIWALIISSIVAIVTTGGLIRIYFLRKSNIQ